MFRWLTNLFARKSGPPTDRPSVASGFLDAHRLRREPTPRDLVNELKGLAWTCASINAAACASHAPRLYVKTFPGQPDPKYAHRPLERWETKALITQKALPTNVAAAEVTDHPLLDLFRTVNPEMNAFDLWELTQLYLEVTGLKTVRHDRTQLLKAGVGVGSQNNAAGDWPTSDAIATSGGPTSLWGTTWTPAEVNNANFGVEIIASEGGVNDVTFQVDHVQITVWYQ